MLDVLDGAGVRRWCVTALDRLRGAAEELNRLNVYPVRDSDTGVNLVTTVDNLCAGLPESADLPTMLEAMSRAALMGAHGNSGTILSQLLRGLAEAAAEVEGIGPEVMAEGLRHGADLAYKAVTAPVEGTILTVAREAAEAAVRSGRAGVTLPSVVEAAAEAAREALRRTPEQLPALAEAGVVDAGGRGWCVMLDALVEVVSGSPGTTAGGDSADPPMLVPREPGRFDADRESGSAGYGFEVQYLLDADPAGAGIPALRARLDALGDSVVVVGGDGLWNVHVHVNDVGAAVEAGVAAGRPHRIRVTRFADQAAGRFPAGQDSDRGEQSGGRVVAVVPGAALAGLMAASGAVAVELSPEREPGPPDAARLLDAVCAAGSTQVALLPNSRSSGELAEEVVAAAREAGVRVAVVPTRSVVQGIAALAVHDGTRAFADDVLAMTSAAVATRYGELAVVEGAVRGLLDGSLAASGTDPFEVGLDVVGRLLAAGGDLVTLVGAAGAGELAGRLRDHLATHRPGVEVQVHEGDHTAPLLVVGVE